MASVGRKAKYPTELLLDKLEQYVEQNPNKLIKLSELQKCTSIPRHIWRDNVVVREMVEKLNNVEVVADVINFKFILPSAVEIVEKNYNNKLKLTESIASILDLATSLYEKAIKGEKFEQLEKEYIIKLQEKDCIIKKKNEEIKKLYDEIDALYLDSRDYVKRTQKGIRGNLIELNNSHLKSISKELNDIESEFKSLFD